MKPKRLVLAFLVGLVACTSSSSVRPTPMAVEPKGEIKLAYPYEPESLHPYVKSGQTIATRDLLRPLLPTLLRVSPDMSWGPALARRVPRGKDLTTDPFTVTFHLRRDLEWSDGTRITSKDVRFTWEAIRNEQLPIADRSGYDLLTDVTVIDDQTLKFVFARRYEYWRELFSAGDFILPSHATGPDFQGAFADSLGVSGAPFLLEGWKKGLELVYVPNPKWKGDRAHLERVRVQIVPSMEIAMRLARAKRLDGIVSSTRVNFTKRLEKFDLSEVKSKAGSSAWWLWLNTERLSDKKIREAVAMAIDRSGFEEALIRGEGNSLDRLLPSRKGPPARFGTGLDLERAKAVLKGSRELVLAYPDDDETAAVLARTIQKGLELAGVEVELRAPPPNEFLTEWLREGKFDLAISELRTAPDPDLRGLFHSAFAAPIGMNYSRLRDEGVDQALLGPNPEQSILDSAAVFPLFESKMFIGHSGALKGSEPNSSVDGPFWNMHAWERVR